MKRKVEYKKNKVVKALSRKRRLIQILLGMTIYLFITVFNISLWWVVGFGSAIGIIWGKVFCRWMCPIGIVMELIMKISPDDSLKNMYQYHKIGCPIAWISGWLNKFSLYKIQFNKETCIGCGKCDKACYMPALDKQKYSFYLPNKENPGKNFSCSKCLVCVEQCPNGSLSFKTALSKTDR